MYTKERVRSDVFVREDARSICLHRLMLKENAIYIYVWGEIDISISCCHSNLTSSAMSIT